MLISPVAGILFFSNSPRLITDNVLDSFQVTLNDTVSVSINKSQKTIDSVKLIDSLDKLGIETKPNQNKKKEAEININPGKINSEGKITGNEKLFFNCLLVSFVIGFLYSLPFKIYFRRKRRQRNIPLKIEQFCRKTAIYSPYILAAIIAFPFICQNLSLIDLHFISNTKLEPFQQRMSMQYWIIFFLAGLLTVAFVYYWQKNNIQLRYLEHIFSREELKKCVYRKRKGRVRNRLVLTSFLTTLLPLSIVVAYLLMSVTSLPDIGLYKPSLGEQKVIFGAYYELLKNGDINKLVSENNLHYINVVDTLLLFIGIGAGIIVTIIYVLFFVHWTNSDIINPVKELLKNMQKTTAGQLENYSLVRTNDELGDLSENYNIMLAKLNEYISHIDKMNAELEQKVKERTAEIQAQKEEIESQRDEVESQRDEIEQQRDYVIEQRDLIILQKKAITDSIEYAAHIQNAILPPLKELESILPEHFIYYKPRDIVSGDFYWAHKIKKKGVNKVVVVAADSTGHGVPGAIMSMLGITLLKEIVVKKEIYKPSEILDNLKENVVNSLHQSDETGKSKDGIDISVCLIDFDNRKLDYSGAYNSIYLVRDIKNGNNETNLSGLPSDKYRIDNYGTKVLIEIKADKNPIGVSHKMLGKYALYSINLEENDMLYMFSDGFADQFGGKKRLKYLYSRFKVLLVGISNEPVKKQYAEIDKELENWKGLEKQVDDILVMGIKIN
jgi:serine phosphatase RsbU (regulator of sigma subunit)